MTTRYNQFLLIDRVPARSTISVESFGTKVIFLV